MKAEEVFTPQEIKDYMSKGFSYESIQHAVNEAGKESDLQNSYKLTQQNKANNPLSQASNSYFTAGINSNLIQWQLELDTILERIEHLLRGDKPTWSNGSIIWKEAGEDDRVFSEKGVAEMMRLLSNYVNRNTILSNYSEDTINMKMYDLGNEVSDLIYLKYESFGLLNLEKRKLYPIIVRQVVDIVHSAYLRALHGGERESLREARQVSQTESFMPGGINISAGGYPKERGLLNPFRYFGSKYK